MYHIPILFKGKPALCCKAICEGGLSCIFVQESPVYVAVSFS